MFYLKRIEHFFTYWFYYKIHNFRIRSSESLRRPYIIYIVIWYTFIYFIVLFFILDQIRSDNILKLKFYILMYIKVWIFQLMWTLNYVFHVAHIYSEQSMKNSINYHCNYWVIFNISLSVSNKSYFIQKIIIQHSENFGIIKKVIRYRK